VRGYGHTEVKLPAQGSVSVPISKFSAQSSQYSEEFFDPELVKQKRQEKLAKVRFFENGVAINDELKPVVYSGNEALQRATFNPRLSVLVQSLTPKRRPAAVG